MEKPIYISASVAQFSKRANEITQEVLFIPQLSGEKPKKVGNEYVAEQPRVAKRLGLNGDGFALHVPIKEETVDAITTAYAKVEAARALTTIALDHMGTKSVSVNGNGLRKLESQQLDKNAIAAVVGEIQNVAQGETNDSHKELVTIFDRYVGHFENVHSGEMLD